MSKPWPVFFAPLGFSLWLVCLALGAQASCRGPTAPLALSPTGHGGRNHRQGPYPVSPLWRANAISAPHVQLPCKVPTGAHQGVGIACPMALPQDHYPEQLARGVAQEGTNAQIYSPNVMADGDEGV